MGRSIVKIDRGGSLVFVVCNPMHWERRIGDEHWGFSVFAKIGASVLALDDNGPHWYCNVPMELLEEAHLFLRRFSMRIGYGYSMGGYGVLKLGSQLALTHAVALSPQISIDPNEVGSFDKRYVEHFDPAIHAKMSIKANDICQSNSIFYDPLFEQDNQHARLLSRLGGAGGRVATFPLRGLAHNTIDLFASSTLMTELTRSIGEVGSLRGDGFIREIRQRQKKSLGYGSYMCDRAARLGHRDMAARIAERAFSSWIASGRIKSPKRREVGIIVSEMVVGVAKKLGIHAAFGWLVDLKWQLGVMHSRPYENLALLALSMRDRSAAVSALEAGMAAAFNPAPLARRLSKIYLEEGRLDEAVGLLESVAHSYVDNPGYLQQYRQCIEARRRRDEQKLQSIQVPIADGQKRKEG